jgi:phosphotransferase system IIB component
MREEKAVSPSQAPAAASAQDNEIAERLVQALGGPANVQKAEHVAVTRLRFVLRDTGKADEEAVKNAGAGSVMKASENVWHVLAGERAPAIASAIKWNLSAPPKTASQLA